MTTKILDACCGSKMFWFDKENQEVTFMDNRELDTTLSDGRKLIVTPDILADFRNMPSKIILLFSCIRPTTFKTGGDKSWLIQKYGRLNKN